MSFEGHQTRDPIEDIWGPRTPYKHEWPVRVDERYTEKPEKWVQSACVLCRCVKESSLHYSSEGTALTLRLAMAVAWTLESKTTRSLASEVEL
jgi:hypothetical protein